MVFGLWSLGITIFANLDQETKTKDQSPKTLLLVNLTVYLFANHTRSPI